MSRHPIVPPDTFTPPRAFVLALLFLLFLGVSPLFGQVIGNVSFLDGEPDVFRDAQPLWTDVDFGLHVENFDRIRTGEDELLEVTLFGDSVRIRFQPETVAAVHVLPPAAAPLAGPPMPGVDPQPRRERLQALEERPLVVVDLLAGAVSVRRGTAVQALETGRVDVVVRMEHSLVEPTTAELEVVMTTLGDALVLGRSGRSLVRDRQGRVAFAIPGRAVEIATEGRLRNVGYEAGNAERFGRSWSLRRMDELAARARDVMRGVWEEYRRLEERFVAEFARLMEEQSVIETAKDQARVDGVAPEPIGGIRTVLRPIAQTAYEMERIAARAQRLARYAAERDMDGLLSPQTSVREFREALAGQQRLLRQRLDTVRYAVKLYHAGTGRTLLGAGFPGR
jgi:hypothetical protein